MKVSEFRNLIREEVRKVTEEALSLLNTNDKLYYLAGRMISQVGLFTSKNAAEIEKKFSDVTRYFKKPGDREELMKISDEYEKYLGKVKTAMDELVKDPMYKVAVGDVGGTVRDKGIGETLEKAYMRSKQIKK